MKHSNPYTEDTVKTLCKIGTSLSMETDYNVLFEEIMLGAIHLTHADAGTLYLKKNDTLAFEVVRTQSLDVAMGGTTGTDVNFPAIELHRPDRSPNDSNVAAHVALHNKTVNIDDAYAVQGFDFSGTRAFDRKTGYRSQSFLTIPMTDHENEMIGVLQLINRQGEQAGEVISFSPEDQHLAESLASQAAVTLSNKYLIQSLEGLFDSFIEMLAAAIDDKSPYTGGHCRRVPPLTMMLAYAADKSNNGKLKDFQMDEKEEKTLKIAGWLHDCGKITTPEYVVDKATKLETIFDRIAVVDTRFEAVRRDARITMLQAQIAAVHANNEESQLPEIEAEYQRTLDQIEDDQSFLRTANIGGEFMSDAYIERVHTISKRYPWHDENGQETPFLTENEIYNLCIIKGTLTEEERAVINHHIVMTIKMLESLKFPNSLGKVAQYAGGHHERVDGKGYPYGLKGDEFCIQARIMAIADVFEALTAKDRPYKKSKTISESLTILGYMAKEGHVDPELFNLFVREKVYLQYAKEFLDDDQIDDVDESKLPGYVLDNA